MALTTQQQIDTGRVCTILAMNEIDGGKRAGGSIDLRLPTLLYSVTNGLEWLYELDPTNTDLEVEGNYLISICKHYSRAQFLINSGGVGVVTQQSTTIISPIRITGADFASALSWAGTNSDSLTILSSYKLQVFFNDANRFLDENISWERTSTGFNIIIDGTVITDFDATTTNIDSVFYVYISL